MQTAGPIFANPTFLFAALSDSVILGKQVLLISAALEYRAASVALVGITGAVPRSVAMEASINT